MIEHAQFTEEEFEYLEFLISFAEEAHNHQIQNGKKEAEETPHVQFAKMLLDIAAKTGEKGVAFAQEKVKELNEVIDKVSDEKTQRSINGIKMGNNIRTKLSILKNEVIQ